MSKPEGIPQDIWDQVENLPLCGDSYPDDSDYEAIARAILAERERCARVAEAYPYERFNREEPDKTVFGWGKARRLISEMIRSGRVPR